MVFSFVVITVILVGIILYFSASKALIKVVPKASAIETDFVIDVISDGGSAEGAMQGVLYETEVDGTIEGLATGTEIVEGSAIGQVLLINKRAESQTLVKTTRLLTQDGILLRLMDRVNVPAGGQIEAAVYADDPNAFEEIQPTTFTIPGLWEGLQTQVYAESTTVLKSTGDSIKVVKAVDIARAKEDLTNQLYDRAIEKFKEQLPNGNYVSQVVSKKIIEESVDVSAGDKKDKFTSRMKLSATLIGVSQDKIIELAGERLKAAVSGGQDLANLDPNTLSYKVQSFDEQKMTANIKIHAAGSAVVKENNEIFQKDKLIGLSPKGVELYLANFDEVESVTVELSPFWVKNIPKLKDHINIVIVSPGN